MGDANCAPAPRIEGPLNQDTHSAKGVLPAPHTTERARRETSKVFSNYVLEMPSLLTTNTLSPPSDNDQANSLGLDFK